MLELARNESFVNLCFISCVATEIITKEAVAERLGQGKEQSISLAVAHLCFQLCLGIFCEKIMVFENESLKMKKRPLPCSLEASGWSGGELTQLRDIPVVLLLHEISFSVNDQ